MLESGFCCHQQKLAGKIYTAEGEVGKEKSPPGNGMSVDLKL